MPLDTMVIDNAAGISEGVLTFCQAAQETVVVVCDDPAAITDAYALVKVLAQERGVRRVQVLANRVEHDTHGRQLFEKLTGVTSRFLDVTLHYLGSIPHDPWLARAAQRCAPVLQCYPSSPASTAFNRLSARVVQWPLPRDPRGHLEFFMERLIKSGSAVA